MVSCHAYFGRTLELVGMLKLDRWKLEWNAVLELCCAGELMGLKSRELENWSVCPGELECRNFA
jgi:hypothetical protein